MTSRAEELLREALALAPEERAGVAAELLASLDETEGDLTDVRRAWAAEIERRAAHALAGGSPGTPRAEVRRRAEREIRRP